MSLRVLLADESDTIKKVFQLALQDLNAEVKSVHSGLDVMDVAKAFKPDIVFADILLQKKNGYEICAQIKQSPDLRNVPVVLMWSSFMELDQNQYKQSQANDQLEKPFDADHLREIVKKHSSAVDENPMAAFLNFPKSIAAEAPVGATSKSGISLNIDLSTENPLNPSAPISLGETGEEENTSEFNLGALLDSEPTATPVDQDALTRPAMTVDDGSKKSLFDDLAIDAAPSTNQESWKEKDLSQFKITEDKSDDLDKFEALNLSVTGTGTATKPAISVPEISFSLGGDSAPKITPDAKEDAPLDRFSLSKTILPPHGSPAGAIPKEPTTNTATATKSVVKTATMTGMNDSEIEAIVRAHTEEVIKNQIQDSLIHVVEKIVREELNRIMEEELRLQQDADIDS